MIDYEVNLFDLVKSYNQAHEDKIYFDDFDIEDYHEFKMYSLILEEIKKEYPNMKKYSNSGKPLRDIISYNSIYYSEIYGFPLIFSIKDNVVYVDNFFGYQCCIMYNEFFSLDENGNITTIFCYMDEIGNKYIQPLKINSRK